MLKTPDPWQKIRLSFTHSFVSLLIGIGVKLDFLDTYIWILCGKPNKISTHVKNEFISSQKNNLLMIVFS